MGIFVFFEVIGIVGMVLLEFVPSDLLSKEASYETIICLGKSPVRIAYFSFIIFECIEVFVNAFSRRIFIYIFFSIRKGTMLGYRIEVPRLNIPSESIFKRIARRDDLHGIDLFVILYRKSPSQYIYSHYSSPSQYWISFL